MASLSRKSRSMIHSFTIWFHRQPSKAKAFLCIVLALLAMVIVRVLIQNHDNLFIAAELIHAMGIFVLIRKLAIEKSSSGLSLKSQELTALFLAVRLYCSFVMEYDIHTILDTATLATTCWEIYMIRYILRPTYLSKLDNFSNYFVVIPCAVLAFFMHPGTKHYIVNRVLWAFCVYLETVSILPQLRMMQTTKVVEPFTAHYVFALGVARFLNCLHWVYKIIDSRALLLVALGRGPWPAFVLLFEIVQTFILADFCYYYVKSLVEGNLVMRLPTAMV